MYLCAISFSLLWHFGTFGIISNYVSVGKIWICTCSLYIAHSYFFVHTNPYVCMSLSSHVYNFLLLYLRMDWHLFGRLTYVHMYHLKFDQPMVNQCISTDVSLNTIMGMYYQVCTYVSYPKRNNIQLIISTVIILTVQYCTYMCVLTYTNASHLFKGIVMANVGISWFDNYYFLTKISLYIHTGLPKQVDCPILRMYHVRQNRWALNLSVLLMELGY